MWSSLKLDLRSLALFRVVLGFILIFDLISRLFVVSDFYVDSGVLPRAALLAEFSNPYFFSIFNMAGKSFYIYFLCGLAFISYLFLLLGYKTRWATVFAWLFFISFSARTPVITHGGDDVIRLALFWLMLLPSGIYYSLDSALNENSGRPTEIFNVASFAFLLQLILVYFFTSLLKWHPIWNQEGTAVYYSLQLDQFLTPFGHIARQLPLSLLKILTFVTLAIELIVPLLVFIPFKNHKLRLFAILIFIPFHFSLFLIFKLGSFPWICMAYWLAFIPKSFWDDLILKLKNKQSEYTLFYDAECGYCFKILRVIQTFFILPFVSIKKAQDQTAILDQMKTQNSWVIQNSKNIYSFHYDVFLKLLEVSPFFWMKSFFSTPFMKNKGSAFYRWQALRRPFISPYFSFLKPTKNNFKSSFSVQIFASFALALALYWNIALFKKDDSFQIPKVISNIGSVLRLHQQWNMFAPYPSKEDGWIVVEGILANGQVWDIFHNQTFTTKKPALVSSMFKDVYWRKYLLNLWNKDYSGHRLYFGRYLCREWNSLHEKTDLELRTFKIYYMLEVSNPPDQPVSIPHQELIWDHSCFL